jgi:hypothetical protein
MSDDHDVGAVAPAATDAPVAVKEPAEGEGEVKVTPRPYEPPEDLGAFPDDEDGGGAPVKGVAADKPIVPAPTPPPTYSPRGESDPWGKSVEYTGEEVYAKGSRVVEDHIRERVGALAVTVGEVVREQDRRIKDLEAKIEASRNAPTPLPKTFIEREHKTAAQFCATKLKEFSEDPAWTNPKVKGYMESGVRQYLKEAASKARKTGDMSDYNFLTDDGFLEGVFYTAKVKAGYKGGTVPSDVSSPQAQLEGVRSRGVTAEDDDIEITPEIKAALKAAHTSVADYKKEIRASQKWNKERV